MKVVSPIGVAGVVDATVVVGAVVGVVGGVLEGAWVAGGVLTGVGVVGGGLVGAGVAVLGGTVTGDTAKQHHHLSPWTLSASVKASHAVKSNQKTYLLLRIC